MKTIYFVLLAMLLVSCAKQEGNKYLAPACQGKSTLGVWNRTGETLVLNESCSGTSTSCASEYTFTTYDNNTEHQLINVTKTNGQPGCLPLGNTYCSYKTSGVNLIINCGTGDVYYAK